MFANASTDYWVIEDPNNSNNHLVIGYSKPPSHFKIIGKAPLDENGKQVTNEEDIEIVDVEVPDPYGRIGDTVMVEKPFYSNSKRGSRITLRDSKMKAEKLSRKAKLDTLKACSINLKTSSNAAKRNNCLIAIIEKMIN